MGGVIICDLMEFELTKAVLDDPEGLIIPVFKPVGLSSFDVIRRLRPILKVKKIGHAGTLDPFADGVLIVGVGRGATRRLDEFQMLEKEYTGEVVLGITTDTFDPTGKQIEVNEYELPDESTIQEVLNEFVGTIEQLPPVFSAVKVNGVRAYKAARKGLEIAIKPREVNVKSIQLMRMLSDGFKMKVICSKGTYIRTLAFDIGRRLGMGAHLGQLTRTRIGSFTVEQSKTIEDIAAWAGEMYRSEK